MMPRPLKTRIRQWGVPMATHLVNLDALIIREDFEFETGDAPPPGSGALTLKLAELEANTLVYTSLRKPDFQRETASWKPSVVMGVIKSFVDGDLIPSLILWRSPKSGNVFVIDGAHRLSALIAWVQNDFGDGEISRRFFANFIPKEQLRAAKQTRDLIEEEVGSYKAIQQAGLNPGNSDAKAVVRAKNVGFLQIDLQWVRGDASKAEASFFKINQQAAPIHPTELRVLQSRRKPNALATRALMHAGVGHKYWGAFPSDVQRSIEATAKEIYDIFFEPSIELPIKTLELPVAGRGYSATSFQLVFELVNFVNKCELGKLPDDTDGSETIKYLMRIKKVASRISGDSPGSLGLHPVVYFYSATARYQPAAFLAIVGFFEFLESRDAFFDFTSVRARFEEFLLKYRYFLNQIVRKYGSGTKASPAILKLYQFLFAGLSANKTEAQLVSGLQADEDLQFLKPQSEYDKTEDQEFGTDQKSATFLRTIDNAPTCSICNARIHRKSISFDHIVRKEDGGSGDSENAQLAHHYCNTGYKEKLNSLNQSKQP